MTELTLAIDQSTQGTKVLLVNPDGAIAYKITQGHRQIISEKGWISHDLTEIRANLKTLIHTALQHTNGAAVTTVAISNQRETAAAWSRKTGAPLTLAVVWQDNRAEALTATLAEQPNTVTVKAKTGLALSPYFTAAKFAWLLANEPEVKAAQARGDLCFGTIDSWLIFTLTGGEFKTEPSNACRTQLMNLDTGDWDPALCLFFGIERGSLPTIVDSDSCFGTTNLFGELATPIPITSVLGDSQAALYAEGCKHAGQFKVTFGTGSSIMLNTGASKIMATNGLNTSIAWRKHSEMTYALEGNVNYSGALVTWLENNLHVISTPAQTDAMAQAANPNDTTILIPAFSGMAAPYNYPELRAALVGMTLLTGSNEIVRAGLNAVVFQIADIIRLMQSQFPTLEPIVHADGGMITNRYLMQRLSNIAQQQVAVSPIQELSGVGAALNGRTAGGLTQPPKQIYAPKMSSVQAAQLIKGWTAQIAQLTK